MRKFFLAAILAVAMALPAAADEYPEGTQPRTIPGDMMGPNDNQLPVDQVLETDAPYTNYNDARYGGKASYGGAQIERASYCLGCHLASTLQSPGRTWAG